MNLRKEIEKLIYWYVPTYIFTITVGVVLAQYAKNIEDPTWLVSYIIVPIGMIASSIDNIVIAIWLYFLAKQLNQKNILWSLFGLVAHIFAVVLFIALYVYEKIYSTEDEEIEEKRILTK
jgi:membrane-bound metal-dependent hydrolase YbcI (DUF457 family)